MSYLTDLNEAIAKFNEAVKSELPKVSTKELGLDERAGFVYVDLDQEMIIANSNNIRTLNYYGGFEYVDADAIKVVGEFTIFSGLYDHTDRVNRALEHYEYHLMGEEGNLPS